MQSLSKMFRPTAVAVVMGLLATSLASCPTAPPPGAGNLRIVVTTGIAGAESTKGLSPIAEDEIIGLEVTIQRVTLLGSSGTEDVVVLSQPAVINLVEMAGMSRLVADIMADEGTYSGASVVLSNASLTLSSDPANPMALALPPSGTYTIAFPFEVLPDSDGILMLDFGGLGLFLDDQNAIVFEPVPNLALRSQVPDVRIEGQVSALDRSGLTFSLGARGTSYTVGFSNSSIYKVGDLEVPTGSPEDLENGQTVAVQGTLGSTVSISPSKIEILDLPETEGSEDGDQITLCHFHSDGASAEAYTIVVVRSLLQTHLDHGDFIGPCDEGDTFTLSYTAGDGGTISGEATQTVAPGANGTQVTAVADTGFLFVDWSDGRTDNPRTDTAVGTNITVTANFIEVFVLRYTAGEGGTLTGQTTQTVHPGAAGTQVTAVRNSGFVFSEWSDGRTDNPRTDENVSADVSVMAIFLPIYTLTYTAGEGGVLDGVATQTVISGSDGTAVTAVPAADFVFVNWSDGSTDNPRTDLYVSGNITVVANFAMEYTLIYTAGPNGSISGVSPQVVPGGLSGSPVTAVPDEGFGFVRWSDGRTDNPRIDMEITGDVTVEAEFATAVSLHYVAGMNGTLSGATEQIIGQGGTGSPVTAVPDDGFGFLQWSDGRTDNPRVDSEVTSDLAVEARFDEAFNVTYSAGTGGTVTGELMQVVISGRSTTAVTAVPNQDFTFSRWSDGRVDNPRTDSNVITDLEVTAMFSGQHTLAYTAGENGRVGGSRFQTVPTGGSGQAVTAVPDSGYSFLDWSDGRTDNPRRDLNVRDDISVTANFVAGLRINYTASEHGSLSGELSQLIEENGAGTPVTAIPSEGFRFLEWSDGRMANPRTDTAVTESATIHATFFRVPDMITVEAGNFIMGRGEIGEDEEWGGDNELPRHRVALSEYEIGRFEVTNEDYAVFMNYMNNPVRDLLRRDSGESWEGHNEAIYYGDEELRAIYIYNYGEVSLGFSLVTHLFAALVKQGVPAGTSYSLFDHPVTESTWYGTILYCNWLSERMGYEPVYDTTTWTADFSKNGYRMPTEAEWERAAAWDGEKHWVFGFSSDTLSGPTRANYYDGPRFILPPDFDNTEFVNPLGLVQDAQTPYTSPVGWFNGVNISPNGMVQTEDSPSPIGAYDMTGNVFEWCHDWYGNDYYEESPTLNPTGPEVGVNRVVRGGAWGRQVSSRRNRTAYRWQFNPDDGDGIIGIRLARSTGETLKVSLEYLAGPNGSIAANATQIVEAGLDGAPVTAVSDEGYLFANWSDGRTDNPRIDTNVTEDVSVTASFTVPVTLTYLAGEHGHIEGDAEQTIGIGGSGTAVTAVADSGYAFLRWSDGRTDNPRTDVEVVADQSVTALFEVAITATYFAGDNGTLSGELVQIIPLGEDGSPVTATPNEGFGFDRWSDGRLDNPRTDVEVVEDITVTASFLEQFTLTYSSGTGGGVEGSLTQLVLFGQDGAPVTAVPSTGFSFDRWSDDRTDNPRIDMAIEGDVSVSAVFIPRVTLTYNAEDNGSITGTLVQELTPGDDGTPVTAVPDEGYVFVQWSDGRTDNPRQDVNVEATLTVSASFFAKVDLIEVPATTFTMGRSDIGDDALYGFSDELPRHEVSLSPYEIGRYEITNDQFVVFLNYLLHSSRNKLRLLDGGVWGGHNADIYYFDTADPQKIFAYRLGEVCVRFNHLTGLIEPSTKPGLPEGTTYNMGPNPVTEPTWYGAVLFCNWLSALEGLEPVYDIDTWTSDLSKNGYRLPTEAEWERAAAWDGEKHWVYGFQSDTLTGRDRCNYHDGPWDPPPDYDNDKFVNPLGLVQDAITPYTNPVGWFNGINISPNFNVQTVDSPSPVGAYDMSGNMVEWCNDWYSATYYSESPSTDPLGPEAGEMRVLRGGAWGRTIPNNRVRTAIRFKYDPGFADGIVGFRVAR